MQLTTKGPGDFEPPQPEVIEDMTSLQPLGDAEVLVCYELCDGVPNISGCLIGGQFVDEDAFSSRTLTRWARGIMEEQAKAAELEALDAWQDARDAA